MRLGALSAGTEAPRGRFDGAVHSVFPKACNIETEDGRLLALLAPTVANLPHGARIDLPAGFAFADRLVAGQRVGCRADRLRFAGSGLTIDLALARLWRSDLGRPGIDWARHEVARAWWLTWRALQRSTDARSPVAWRRAVEQRALALGAATRRRCVGEAARAVAGLIGCGPGLTPSGDDLIVGFLAGLWRGTGADPERLSFLTALGASVFAAARATGDVSRAHLRHATSGHFAEPIALLARCLGDGARPAQVERAVADAVQVGHLSGSDGVLGLLLGVRAWAPDGWPPVAVDRAAAVGSR